MRIRRASTLISGIALLAFSLSTAHAAPVVEPPGGPVIQTPNPPTPAQDPNFDPSPSGSSHTSSPANITVNVTPPPPDPAATQAMMDYFVANTEYNHANVPVTIASGLLKGRNIWTTTPWEMVNLDIAQKIRTNARNVALSLFLLGILWVGTQLVFGSAMGTTSMQQLFPLFIAGFVLCFFSELIAHRMIDLNDWMCQQLGDPSLADFSQTGLTLPEQPKLPSGPTVPGIVGVPAAFFSGLITTLIYAIVLIILELKLIFRDAVLVVATTLMPISGALFATSITRGWGIKLYQLFFGWLFGQPIVVVCLAIASSLLTLFNDVDSAAQVFVKLAVLFLAIKSVSFFASGMGGSGLFGLAGLVFLINRMHQARNALAGRGGGTAAPAPQGRAAELSGQSGGTGDGTAAHGRAWRPAYGAA